MSIFEHHREKEKQQYWVEYYKKYNIEYSPDKGIKWDYFTYDFCNNDIYSCSVAIIFLLSEFKILQKNICSYSQAVDYWIGACNNKGFKCTREDVKEAYTLAYGHGCEFEFREL